jgi:cytochrome c556
MNAEVLTMRVRSVVLTLMFCIVAATLAVVGVVAAQTPAAGRGGAPAQGARVHGNLAQLMRGILYPASTVVFAAQSVDPETVKPDGDASTSPNPLSSSYGGWQAVENAGIALAEAANLLSIPGRACLNGKPTPSQNADWQKWVEELRAAGMAAYKAGQAKSQDAVLDAADVMSVACSNCHEKYRDVPGGVANRCM